MAAATDGRANELITIVVVNYNGAATIEACLGSIENQPYRPVEVIVVDNASRDGSTDIVRRGFPTAKLLVNGVNRGFAAACNQGVAASDGDLVVLLNNDTVVEREWLPALLRELEQPGIGAVTSRVMTEGVPAEYYERNGTINYLGYNIMREFADLSRVFFAGGASLVFRKSIVGPPFLDEYFLYHEDVLLSWRLRLQGYGIRMAQGSHVLHKGSAASSRHPSSFVTFYQERNRVLTALLCYEKGTLLRLLPYFAADTFARVTLSVVAGRKSFRGIVHSLLWIGTHLRWIRERRAEIQVRRRVDDREIMRWMSSKVVDGSSFAARALNSCSGMYARLVGLSSHA